jgi:hypothetical protein
LGDDLLPRGWTLTRLEPGVRVAAKRVLPVLGNGGRVISSTVQFASGKTMRELLADIQWHDKNDAKYRRQKPGADYGEDNKRRALDPDIERKLSAYQREQRGQKR